MREAPPERGRARRGLLAAAAVGAGLWALHVLVACVRGEGDAWLFGAAGLNVAATVTIVLVALRAKQDRTRLLTGFLHLLATSLLVSVVELHAGLGAGVGAGVSWNAVWIAFFPLMVPCTARATLYQALMAATMTPIAFLFVLVLPGAALPGPVELVALFAPVYLAAFLAWSVARVYAKLTGALDEARSVGRYELVARLGEGGMGEVWKARHPLLAQPVALKLLKPRGDDRGLMRFRREARVMARLRSPHTVSLLDFGATEDGRLFYTMELLEGLDLEQLVKRHGPMSPSRVVHVLEQALRSLEEAHRRGLVHRDIKPANLHLGRIGLVHDHVTVLDFGLVKPADGATTLGPTLTADGSISGTPAYIAPESLVGDGEIDGRADVYALCCVAVYLLTGERVFEADDAMRAAVAHVTETPVPPSERGCALPARLEALLMTGLEKDPVRRPDARTMRALLGQLELTPWTQEDAARWWAGHPMDESRDGEPPTPSTPWSLPARMIVGHA